MDAYQFDETFKAIRGFSWDILADNYIELAKSSFMAMLKEKKLHNIRFLSPLTR